MEWKWLEKIWVLQRSIDDENLTVLLLKYLSTFGIQPMVMSTSTKSQSSKSKSMEMRYLWLRGKVS